MSKREELFPRFLQLIPPLPVLLSFRWPRRGDERERGLTMTSANNEDKLPHWTNLLRSAETRVCV